MRWGTRVAAFLGAHTSPAYDVRFKLTSLTMYTVAKAIQTATGDTSPAAAHDERETTATTATVRQSTATFATNPGTACMPNV
jgi:hypothetical protein